MKQSQLRAQLEELPLDRLRTISTQVCGTKNSSMRKAALIGCLLEHPTEVARQLASTRRERPTTHAYGITGLVLAAVSIAATVMYSPGTPASTIDPPTVMYSPGTAAGTIDPLDVLNKVEVLRSTPTLHVMPVDLNNPRPGDLNHPEPDDPDHPKSFDLDHPMSLEAALEMDIDEGFRIDIKDLPEVFNENVQLIEEEITWDLREFKRISSSDANQSLMLRSRAIQTIRLRLLKRTKADHYRLTGHTAGADLFARSSTHPDNFKLYASGKPEKVDDYMVRRRIIDIDISDEATDQPFPVEITKEFWNSMQNDDQSWVGMVMPTGMVKGGSARKVSFLVVFPDDTPFSVFRLFVTNQATGTRVDITPSEGVVVDPQKLFIYWSIENPIANHTYNIDWEW